VFLNIDSTAQSWLGLEKLEQQENSANQYTRQKYKAIRLEVFISQIKHPITSYITAITENYKNRRLQHTVIKVPNVCSPFSI
jgi:hypothetical protein